MSGVHMMLRGTIRAAGSDLEVGHELHLHQEAFDRFEFEMVYLLSHECIMFHISIDSQSIFFYSLTWNSIFHWAFAQIPDLNIWYDLDSYIGANLAAMFHTWLIWLIKRLLKYIQNIMGTELNCRYPAALLSGDLHSAGFFYFIAFYRAVYMCLHLNFINNPCSSFYNFFSVPAFILYYTFDVC